MEKIIINGCIYKENILFQIYSEDFFPKYLRNPENKDIFSKYYLNSFRAMTTLEERILLIMGVAALLWCLHLKVNICVPEIEAFALSNDLRGPEARSTLALNEKSEPCVN